MPFSQWLKNTKHAQTWNNLLLAGGMFVSMLVAVIVVIHVNDQREERQKREGRAATCFLVNTILAAYEAEDNPPPSETRENVIAAWREIGRLAKCPER